MKGYLHATIENKFVGTGGDSYSHMVPLQHLAAINNSKPLVVRKRIVKEIKPFLN